jgi:hypothetical protein
MRLLERTIPLRASGVGGTGQKRATVQLVKRVVADQLLMAPLGVSGV